MRRFSGCGDRLDELELDMLVLLKILVGFQVFNVGTTDATRVIPIAVPLAASCRWAPRLRLQKLGEQELWKIRLQVERARGAKKRFLVRQIVNSERGE